MTLRQIAKQAQVSKSTVSRVLNNDPHVSASTRERVWQIIREARYQPGLAGRALSRKRTGIVALAIPSGVEDLFNDPYYFFILRGVYGAATAREYLVILWLVDSRAGHDEVMQHRLAASGAIEGAVVADASSADGVIEALERQGVPYTLIGRPARPEYVPPYVSVNNQLAAQEATRHLIQLGRKRIGHIGGPAFSLAALDREAGYRLALQEAGFPMDERLIEQGRFTEQSGETAAEALLEQGVDAIFAANDLMAVGALHAVEAKGKRVPHDVALVGFDDLPVAVTVRPALTTVRQPMLALGAAAAAMLLDSLNSTEVETPVLLETALIVRDSCGARVQQAAQRVH